MTSDLALASFALAVGDSVKAKFLAIRAIGALDVDGASEYAEQAKQADAATVVALAGYLGTYSGPWGLKASEEDAVLGIIDALWPTWAEGERSGGIYKFRADDRLGAVADDLAEDCGETDTIPLVERLVAQLRGILTS